ncbi:MAG: ATP-dependent DNA helicase RecG [Patescibacteria group bacterium]|nr:ATP-dependent DNA helicase RecG [Patescibacteria group bacterium]
MLAWSDPVTYIHGLTAQQRRVLKQLEVGTVGDLLSILPRRYDDYSNLVKIAYLPIGEPVTLKVKIKQLKKMPSFRRRFVMVRGLLEDETGAISATWFNQPWMLEQLKPGDEIYISGAARRHPRYGLGFVSPLWEPANAETLAAGNIAPVYPLVGQVTQKTLRKIMKAAVEDLSEVTDPMPSEILEKEKLPTLIEALRLVHRPETNEAAELGRHRFVFDEVLYYQLALRLARNLADRGGAPTIKFDETFAKSFVSQLPFELTPDQKRGAWAAFQDMEQGRPMRRLLQGDVGSGKTVVAAFCAAMVYRSGLSTAFMAPTDILAKQHALTLQRFFKKHNIPILLITSSTRYISEGGEETKLTVQEAKDRLAVGRIVAVGTHALLEREQCPSDLALAIVDEQHRFGVAQREALTVLERPDKMVPHLLSMTATPIPRSLTLTLLGDLDVSIIRTKPAGRLPITTRILVGDVGRNLAYQAIKEAISRHEQAFIVCPLIDPSDKLGSKSVEEEIVRLRSGPLKGVKLLALHGKMSAADKDQAMNDFKDKKADVLIATTVVEVGVDIPNATVMLIESAERFGLAQLHQLRGRIGRSDKPCTCYLTATDEDADISRLRVLERTNDGFVVAEEDLKIRGSGNLLGFEQSGKGIFKYARPDDIAIMSQARDTASQILKDDPLLQAHISLRERAEQIRETAHGE